MRRGLKKEKGERGSRMGWEMGRGLRRSRKMGRALCGMGLLLLFLTGCSSSREMTYLLPGREESGELPGEEASDEFQVKKIYSFEYDTLAYGYDNPGRSAFLKDCEPHEIRVLSSGEEESQERQQEEGEAEEGKAEETLRLLEVDYRYGFYDVTGSLGSFPEELDLFQILFSPDGRKALLYTYTDRFNPSSNILIWLYNMEEGSLELLYGGAWDDLVIEDFLTFNGGAWSESGRYVTCDAYQEIVLIFDLNRKGKSLWKSWQEILEGESWESLMAKCREPDLWVRREGNGEAFSEPEGLEELPGDEEALPDPAGNGAAASGKAGEIPDDPLMGRIWAAQLLEDAEGKAQVFSLVSDVKAQYQARLERAVPVSSAEEYEGKASPYYNWEAKLPYLECQFLPGQNLFYFPSADYRQIGAVSLEDGSSRGFYQLSGDFVLFQALEEGGLLAAQLGEGERAEFMEVKTEEDLFVRHSWLPSFLWSPLEFQQNLRAESLDLYLYPEAVSRGGEDLPAVGEHRLLYKNIKNLTAMEYDRKTARILLETVPDSQRPFHRLCIVLEF